MTKVVVLQDGDWVTVTATGHATGSEKVCAGISAILYALAGYIANYEQMGNADFKSGEAHIMARHSAATDMAVIGLAQIAQAEPKYLKVFLKNYRLRGE